MEPSLQDLITLEVTKLTAVEAEPWMHDSVQGKESKPNLKNDKAVTTLNLFSLLVAFCFLFLQKFRNNSCNKYIYQILGDALPTKLPHLIFPSLLVTIYHFHSYFLCLISSAPLPHFFSKIVYYRDESFSFFFILSE